MFVQPVENFIIIIIFFQLFTILISLNYVKGLISQAKYINLSTRGLLYCLHWILSRRHGSMVSNINCFMSITNSVMYMVKS